MRSNAVIPGDRAGAARRERPYQFSPKGYGVVLGVPLALAPVERIPGREVIAHAVEVEIANRDIVRALEHERAVGESGIGGRTDDRRARRNIHDDRRRLALRRAPASFLERARERTPSPCLR